MKIFPRMRTASREDMSGNSVVVIGVKRLTELEHDKVRNIDDIIDRTNTRAVQAIHNPCRRWGNLHITQDTRRKASTEIRVCNLNRDEIRGIILGRLSYLNLREMQFFSGQCCNLTCNPDHAEAVCTIRRQLELKHDIVQPKRLCCGNPDRCVIRQDIDPVNLLIGQSFDIDREFPRRAHHSV